MSEFIGIDIPAFPDDDVSFVSLVQRIVNGAVLVYTPQEVFALKVDNWFDHKWLRFSKESSPILISGKSKTVLPPFDPHRIRHQHRFILRVKGDGYSLEGSGMPIHLYRKLRRGIKPRQMIAKFPSAVIFWYSGNTKQNDRGSLMLYSHSIDPEREAARWFASFAKKKDWKFKQGFETNEREIKSFEEQSRLLESRSS